MTKLIQEHATHTQQGFGYRSNARVSLYEIENPSFERTLGHLAQPQTKDLERAAH
jgi:hypothetical protein